MPSAATAGNPEVIAVPTVLLPSKNSILVIDKVPAPATVPESAVASFSLSLM